MTLAEKVEPKEAGLSTLLRALIRDIEAPPSGADRGWLTDPDGPGPLAEVVLALPARWQPIFIASVIEGKPPRVVVTETKIPRGTFQHWTTTEVWLTAERAALAIQARSRVNAWRRLMLAADAALIDALSGEGEMRDRLKAAEIVYDRSGLAAGAKVDGLDDMKDTAAPPLHTPEGRAALIAELKAIPADILAEAIRAREASGPAHLRQAATE